MQKYIDSCLVVAMALFVSMLSLTTFAQTDIGTPSKGWMDGNYQRSYEARFEGALPTQSLAVNAWASLRWALFGEASAGAVVGGEDWLFTEEEFQQPRAPRNFEQELLKVARRLAEVDATLVPVIVPDKARMHRDHLPMGRSEEFTKRYDTALNVLRAVGMRAIDLRPALSFDTSYLPRDTHWSPEGAQAAAEAIAASVQDVSLEPASFETTQTGRAAHDADLSSFVPTGYLRAWVGPATDFITTYDTQGSASGGLFGDPIVSVALVGTSYSARPDFHFEGFLKSALQADVMNLAAVGQGPFTPMEQFLSDLDSLSSVPSLVIWEIPERYIPVRK